LEAINASKTEMLSDKERFDTFRAGTKLVEQAFKANQRSAAAANCLCEVLLRQGDNAKVIE
jgi:RNA polymerase-associated protein CTR9